MKQFVVFVSIILITRCKEKIDYYHIDTFSNSNKLHAVIEIPSGTNSKIEYNPSSGLFEIDKEKGKDRIIKYLAYPANYGFIPGTLSNKKEGGDGDALDIMVLSASMSTGTLVEVTPIAVLKLIDNGEEDYKIIAVPSNIKQRTIHATSLNQINTEYKEALRILEMWFLNYNPRDPAQSLGWGDENEALQIITKSSIKIKD